MGLASKKKSCQKQQDRPTGKGVRQPPSKIGTTLLNHSIILNHIAEGSQKTAFQANGRKLDPALKNVGWVSGSVTRRILKKADYAKAHPPYK